MAVTIARVLVIDDDPEIQRLILLSLRRVGGWEAVAAADGPSGVDLARTWTPDLILLDLQMPGWDGARTLAALHADPATAAIPVVLLTATADPGVLAHHRGVLGALRKPFQPLELPAQLRALVAR